MKTKFFYLYTIILAAGLISGCSSNLKLVADGYINEGVRLPVDLIMVENSKSVLAIGPDSWFGDHRRDALLRNEQLLRLSFSGGEAMDYDIKMGSEVDELVIYADYVENNDRQAQQVVIPKCFFGWKHTLMIKKNGLELKE